jgi:mannose-1-phosphate guanylyltransferase/phosphomannomutase
MREVVEHAGSARTDTTDGVKMVSSDGRWVLVIPDPAEAMTHLWAEGTDTADSARLLQTWGGIVSAAIGTTGGSGGSASEDLEWEAR